MSGFRMSHHHPTRARIASYTKEPIKFFYVFFEGVETELRYFTELSKSAIVQDDVEIKIMDRWKSKRGDSNQYQIVKNIESFIESCKRISKKDKKKIKRKLELLNDQSISINDIVDLLKLVEPLVEDGIFGKEESVISQLNAIITISDFTPDYDSICVVIDRDSKSFSEAQFDDVIDIAERHKFKLALSNPNFELYLLLHISNLSEFDQLSFLENPKVTGKIRYTEHCLRETLKERKMIYKKSNYDAKYFVDRFEIGCQNSEGFASEVTTLRNSLGSSLFGIVRKIVNVNES